VVTIRAFAASDYPAVLAIDEAEQQAYRGALWDAASEVGRAAFLMTSEATLLNTSAEASAWWRIVMPRSWGSYSPCRCFR
jgi:hypothetical protein